MTALVFLLSIFISNICHVPSNAHVLSGNAPKRISECTQPHCDFKCPPTKCSHEEIRLWNPDKSIKPSVTLHCMEQYSCLGHIDIQGVAKGLTKRSQHKGGTSKVYCNNARQRSCEDSQFAFVDIDHQYIFGSVSKSEIVFHNAESVHIVLSEYLETNPDQFFMNSIWTVNVKQFYLNAAADYSAVGNVFDLSGVVQQSTISCRGYQACSGSLFIYSRCQMQPHKGHKIHCYNGACNDISVWVLYEDTDDYPCPKGSKIELDKEIVKIIPKQEKKKEKMHKSWQKQNIFIVTDVVKEDKINGLDNLGLYIPMARQQRTNALSLVNIAKSDSFDIHVYSNKEEWVAGIAKLVKSVFCRFRENYVSSVDTSWTRSKEGTEAYGMHMLKVMTTRIQWGSMTQGLTALGLHVFTGAGFIASLGSCAIPLIPLAIVWGGAHVVNDIGGYYHGRRFVIPKSKLAEGVAVTDERIEAEEYKQRVKDECLHMPRRSGSIVAQYADFGDGFVYDDMVYEDYYGSMESMSMEMDAVSDMESIVSSDSQVFEYPMITQYIIISVVVLVCWFLSILIAMCGGAFGGVLLMKSKYINHNEDTTFVDIDV